ncbi:nucleotide exchange factor GrpE [Streptomyces nogalater]|uniref:Protein GrpE n=1 Tax=Streptomyces nogalater TaxID=38314 RepID=A0ABW0WK93_STRNO
MTGTSGTERRRGPSLSVVGDTRRRDPGTSLEPRRRGDVEPARQPAAPSGEAAALRARLRECTADLRRVQAEFDNYRRRVGRDRLAVREIAVANVLTGLLPVLDAIGQARGHGEVTGGFRRVTEVLESELAALGLRSFGTAGDPFDPTRHEAVSCTYSADVRQPTCTVVLRPGYRVGDQLLRPAQVEVAEPGRT